MTCCAATTWEGAVHHGNHSPIMAIMVQRVPLWIPAYAGMTAEHPPFAERKGVRGMLCRHSGGHNMPHHRPGIPCVSLRSPRPLTLKRRGRDGKIMAIIRPSWQSWFTPMDSRLRENDVLRGKDGDGAEHHGNHSPIMAIMVQPLRGRCNGA